MPRHPLHICVRPRFTAGSPAQVSSNDVDRIAAQEQRAHGFAFKGHEGETRQRLAQDEHALYGIAYTLQERRKGWKYIDLITREVREISYAQWRIEDALIRDRRAPSIARAVAEALIKAMPKLQDDRASDAHRIWTRLFDAYLKQGLAVQKRALNQAVRETAMEMSA